MIRILRMLTWRHVAAGAVAVFVPGGLPIVLAATILSWWKKRQAKRASPTQEAT